MTTSEATLVVDDSALRADLLAKVAGLSGLIAAHTADGETGRRLPDEVVDALVDAGLWRLRLARELGGHEASIVTQIEVLRELARLDTSVAWCTMVANNALALIGAYLPEAAIDRIFADGVPRCAIVAAPAGTAVAVDGGYSVTGTWRFASASRHAEWVLASTLIDGDPARPLLIVVPGDRIESHDNWDVLGLRGTGSSDFSLTEHVVPSELATPGRAGVTRLRGTRDYARSDVEFLESYEHLAIALGLAERALAEVAPLLVAPSHASATPRAEREVVQAELGRLDLRLDALRAGTRALFASLDAILLDPAGRIPTADRHKPRALASIATDLAIECTEFAFRRAGGRAIYLPGVFERILRDSLTARQHIVISDTSVSSHGAALIEASRPAT